MLFSINLTIKDVSNILTTIESGFKIFNSKFEYKKTIKVIIEKYRAMLNIRPRSRSIVPMTGILCIIEEKNPFKIEKEIINIKNKIIKDIISAITREIRYKYESKTVFKFLKFESKFIFSKKEDFKNLGNLRVSINKVRLDGEFVKILVSGGKFKFGDIKFFIFVIKLNFSSRNNAKFGENLKAR